jgi:hypothetical protein
MKINEDFKIGLCLALVVGLLAVFGFWFKTGF